MRERKRERGRLRRERDRERVMESYQREEGSDGER